MKKILSVVLLCALVVSASVFASAEVIPSGEEITLDVLIAKYNPDGDYTRVSCIDSVISGHADDNFHAGFIAEKTSYFNESEDYVWMFNDADYASGYKSVEGGIAHYNKNRELDWTLVNDEWASGIDEFWTLSDFVGSEGWTAINGSVGFETTDAGEIEKVLGFAAPCFTNAGGVAELCKATITEAEAGDTLVFTLYAEAESAVEGATVMNGLWLVASSVIYKGYYNPYAQ